MMNQCSGRHNRSTARQWCVCVCKIAHSYFLAHLFRWFNSLGLVLSWFIKLIGKKKNKIIIGCCVQHFITQMLLALLQLSSP